MDNNKSVTKDDFKKELSKFATKGDLKKELTEFGIKFETKFGAKFATQKKLTKVEKDLIVLKTDVAILKMDMKDVKSDLRELKDGLLDWKSQIFDIVDGLAVEIHDSREHREITSHQIIENQERIGKLECKVFGSTASF